MADRTILANAIRILAVDAVQHAKSGHPGMPMGMADIAEVLWNDFLKHNPNHPNWFNRDRFILSNGHGSMLQYALLHLAGYDLSIEQLKQFRQLHSQTPGHPEAGETQGVETTTGPLGQGLANAVGMAIAEHHLGSIFNKPTFPIVNHHTYVFLGDGCLMEGISHEAASLAGTFGLGKLIAFYDDNRISIDGDVQGWFTDNTPARFKAYHWHVIEDIDGHNSDAVAKAIEEAIAHTDAPSILCCRTQIGYGSPNLQGSAKTHGAPLGETEIEAVRKQLNWHHPAFHIPKAIYDAFDKKDFGQRLEHDWAVMLGKYKEAHPDLYHQFIRQTKEELPETFHEVIQHLIQEAKTSSKAIATRKASQQCLNAFAPKLPDAIGGSADLTESNLTQWDGAQAYQKDYPKGRYIHYGVREFGMSAIANGLACHGGLIPFVGTFLVFSDYARNAIRLSALMKKRVIYVFTHDSIGLGEDGPTHQPIEHIQMLRITPNVTTWRPCDLTETIISWEQAIMRTNGPTCLLLSRQSLPPQPHEIQDIDSIRRGGYILKKADKAKAVLLATGSEVSIAMETQKALLQQNITTQVVSMPSPETFISQDLSYRENILPRDIPIFCVEAGSPHFWYQFTSPQHVLGIERFGASAPGDAVYNDCGITSEAFTSLILQHID